jgi:alpha-beta hydrolase superfamily lysophospholipase
VDAIPDMTKWLMENVPEDKKIVICGKSLGSFVAIRLAHELQDRCNGLILISPMLSAISARTGFFLNQFCELL